MSNAPAMSVNIQVTSALVLVDSFPLHCVIYCPASLQTGDFRLDVIHCEVHLVRWYVYIVTNTLELHFVIYP